MAWFLFCTCIKFDNHQAKGIFFSNGRPIYRSMMVPTKNWVIQQTNPAPFQLSRIARHWLQQNFNNLSVALTISSNPNDKRRPRQFYFLISSNSFSSMQVRVRLFNGDCFVCFQALMSPHRCDATDTSHTLPVLRATTTFLVLFLFFLLETIFHRIKFAVSNLLFHQLPTSQ